MRWFLHNVLHMPLDDNVFDALHTIEHRDGLRTNAYLTPHQWDALWEKRLPSKLASALCNHALTPSQVDRVLREERRGSSLVGLFYHPVLTPAQQETILRTASGSQFAYQALCSPYFHRPHLSLAAELFRGTERIEWCASNQASTSLDEAFEAYAYCETSKGLWQLRNVSFFAAALTKLLTAFPALTAKILDADLNLRPGLVQLASSRYLVDHAHQQRVAELAEYEYAKLALVSNPVVALDIVERFTTDASKRVADAAAARLQNHPVRVSVGFDELDDAEQLTWLVKRSLPNQYREAGRPWDLPPLACNPHLPEAYWRRMHTALLAANPRTLSVPDANHALDVLDARIGRPTTRRLVERGFWDECFEFATLRTNDPYGWLGTNWLVDPAARPWTDAHKTAARAAIPDEHLTVINETPTDNGIGLNLPRESLHAYLVSELETPAQWRMFVSLLETQNGSIARTCTIAKKLSR